MSSNAVGVVAAVLVGLVFLLAAITKLARMELWRAESSGLGVPWVVARVVPYTEAVLGALLLVQVQRHIVAWCAVAMLVAFTLLLAVRLAQGSDGPCACFGSVGSSSIGVPHLVRNIVFIGLGVVAALL
ncbi:MAG: MauE/DoxX family redox-associated membrane protein [Actinomycetota bacterium]